jgi:hypothetical protein
MDEDKLCVICQTTMECLAFDAQAEQGEQEGGGFRLSCKHAFHSQCALIAFRTSSSTACPCCRNTEGVTQTITRGRFSLQVTEFEEEEENEVDMEDLMNSDLILRKVRTTDDSVKRKRGELKIMKKEYNLFRDSLRKLRREYVSKALKEFRLEYRNAFRDMQNQLVEKASEVVDKEVESYCNETSREVYDALPWKELHEFERGNQFKITSSDVRHTDPWNSSFWYA